jgi:PAS domain S-box-containing protein
MIKKKDRKPRKIDRAGETDHHSKNRSKLSKVSTKNQGICHPTADQGTWIGSAKREDLIAVLNNLPCGVSVLGSAFGKALYINRELLNTLGYPLTIDPKSSTMMKKAFPDQKARRAAYRSWRQVLEAGGGTELFPYCCGDGKTRVFETWTLVLRKNLILNTWVDVTRRQAAEERLEESETRFRSFFERSTDPFLLFKGMNLIDCNLAAQNLFNCQNTADIIGKTLEDLSPEKQADGKLTIKKTLSLFNSALKHGNQRTEWTIETRDGRNIPVELSITAIMLEGENLLFVVLRDITPWKEAHAVLLNAKTELENAVRARTSELIALNEELRNSREELRHLSEYLQRAREGERIRIAREVHDRIGQFLTGLKMDLVYQTQNPPHDPAAQLEQTEAMIEEIDGAIRNIQEICSELRPAILGHFGLTAAIRWYLEEFEKRTGIHCRSKIDSEFPMLDKESDTLLFRIFQEVMTNVLRHANATTVSVILRCDKKNLMLKIKDNGRGILKEETMHHRSFGIIGIRERVRFRGGRSDFLGAPNKGTIVTVWLPLNRNYLSNGPDTGPEEDNNRYAYD